MPGLIRIPSHVSLPTAEIFCRATALKGAGSGSGTHNDPYTDLQQAINQAKSQGKRLGVFTGTVLDVSSHVSLTATAGIYNVTAAPGFEIVAVPEDSDVPAIFESAKKIGEDPSEWEKVDIKENGEPGDPITHDGGVYDPWQPGMLPVWHYKPTISPSVTIAGVSYGTRDSIKNIITPANYKQSGIDSEGVEVGWAADSSGEAVINTSNVQRSPFNNDMQWCQTDNGGLLVFSEENPATRWGGVYVYQQDSGILHIQESPDADFAYALQGRYVGKLFQARNNNDEVMQIRVIGLGAEHYGRLWHLTTDNRTPNFGSGSTGTGSVDMTAGTNTDVFGDGTEPWLEVEMSHVSGYYGYSSNIALGWIRRTKIYDVDLDMQCLQGQGGVLIAWSGQAPMGDHNEIYKFKIRRASNGAGRFGRTDGGVGFDGPCGGISLHHGIFEECAWTVQVAGARRNQAVHNVLFRDVLRGPYISDELDDGNGSHQVVNNHVILSNPQLWNISQHPVASADWTKAVAYEIRADIGYPAKGHGLDTDIMSKNDGTILENNTWSLGSCPPELGYGLRNETIGASAVAGPWDDTDGDGVAENGESVTPGQTQIRGQVLATVVNFASPSSSLEEHRVVDANFDDANDTQTITSHVVYTPAETSEGALTDNSDADLRTGGEPLDPVLVDAPIPYTRHAVNTTDLRGIPRYSPSFGPLQWIPKSEGPVDLF